MSKLGIFNFEKLEPIDRLFNLIDEDNNSKKPTKIIGILAKYDISPGTVNNNGLTMLSFCCKKNYTEYALELIKKYGDLNHPELQDKEGNTALLFTVRNMNINLSHKLLEMDRTWLNINKMNNDFSCVLLSSILNELKSIFDILINDSRIDVNLSNNRGENILFITLETYIKFKDMESFEYYIEKLIDAGANVDQKTNSGESTLLLCDKLPSYIVNKIFEIKNITCNETGFKRFNTSDFTQVSEIGLERGSYGQVFPVIEKISGKHKILKKYLDYDSDKPINTDIIKEIFYLNTINDRYKCNVSVNLDGICQDKNNFYLVLQPLDMKLNEYFNIINKLPNRETYILKMVENLIKVVYDIHCLGICHNDIKISNIMVHDGQIYLIDFGISSLLLVAPNNNIEYLATENIKAPDKEYLTYVNKNYDGIVSPSNNYSYHSDVFSIGVTLLNVILGDYYSRYMYVEKTKTLYRNKLDNNNKTVILIPLTKEELNKINNCGDYMYDLLISMVNSDANKRIKLGDLLNGPKKKFEGHISEFYFDSKNKIYKRLTFYNKIYSSHDIRNSCDELEYLEEIASNYRNKIINLKFEHIQIQYIVGYIFKLMDHERSLSFDNFINVIIMIRNNVNPTSSKSVYKFKSLIYINYCSSISSLSLINNNIIFSETKPNYEEFKIEFNEFVISNQSYEPIYIHIQYIMIQMRLMDIEYDIISKFEWYAMEMMIKLVMSVEKEDINVWNFILEIAFKFANDNILPLHMFENFISNNYDLKSLEKYELDFTK